MRTLFSFIFLIMTSLSFGQFTEPKFGKIDEADLAMTKYENDTTAEALMLFDYGTTKFILSPEEQFQFVFERHFRIKIFKKSAFRLADFKFSLYESGASKEKITDLKAVTYNLVDGKVVKTKLDNDNIFEEKSNNYYIEKFAFPQVKEGSVIELSYSITSDFLYNLRGWTFQYSIPAIWSQYICEIPEYFIYRQTAKGYLPFDIAINDRFEGKFTVLSRGETHMMPGGGARTQNDRYDIRVNTSRQILATKNVPAFISEPNIDCEDNYISSIEYELASIKFPNEPSKDYAKTWESVNDQMKQDEDFGQLLKADGFIKDTVKFLIKDKTTQLEKASSIYSYVQKKMKWNGLYKIWSTKGLKKPYADRTGSSSEINLLLTVMLKNAGLDATPVLFSTRDNGTALSAFPTISKFNSVLTRLVVEGKIYLLDATSEFCPFGFLPANDINGQGRVINELTGDWVNLETKMKFSEVKNYVLNITPEGNFTGFIKESYDGYGGIYYRESIDEEKSNDDYIKILQENTKGLNVLGYSISEKDNIYKPLTDSLNVEITDRAEIIGDKILFQPMLFETLEKNRYTLEDRKYPVNYNYPISETYLFEYTIPDGYQVESLPKPAVMKLPDNSIAVYYDIKNAENKITVVYKRSVTKILFLPEEYKSLKELYNQIVNKHAESIILRKTI
ncbi:MAG: DUF3857 domain-containing protein [Bacteroidales bacterium]|nr:DUF3857 domain-containing protein [Bacteroidales bacterium]